MVQAESGGPPGIRKTGTAREFRRFCETSGLSPFCPTPQHTLQNERPATSVSRQRSDQRTDFLNSIRQPLPRLPHLCSALKVLKRIPPGKPGTRDYHSRLLKLMSQQFPVAPAIPQAIQTWKITGILIYADLQPRPHRIRNRPPKMTPVQRT